MTNKELKEKVLSMATTNHIWINAFDLIRPTDKTYIDIGRIVVNMLRNKENLLPSYYEDKEFENDELTDIQKMTDCLYLYINQS